jgi:AraC-like DNA-binding protein/mannose-6-phosphate isomerase-like protein (cupin superfamily)
MRSERGLIRPSEKLPAYGIRIESRLQRPGNTRPHCHRSNSLMYVVAGRGQCIVEGASWPVGPDTAIAMAAGRLHQLVDAPGEPMAVFVVYFTGAIAKAAGGMAEKLLNASQPCPVPRHYAQQIRRMLRRMLHEQVSQPPEYSFAIQQCLAMTMLELHRVSQTGRKRAQRPQAQESVERVRDVLEYVRSRYYEQQSLAGAARTAYLSQRQFANICRKLTGRSFVSYVNAIRCDRAKELLTTTEMPVSAIAFETGFEELSTFYRAFGKHHGASPLSFRR